jgi:hypothetical protein
MYESFVGRRIQRMDCQSGNLELSSRLLSCVVHTPNRRVALDEGFLRVFPRIKELWLEGTAPLQQPKCN